MSKSLYLRLAVGLLAPVAMNAAIVTFINFDAGAGSANPRPASNSAAASFDAAAAALGTVNIITFESAPLGAFSNLQVAPGVSINGIDVNGANQTIRNTPFASGDNLFGYNTTAGGSQFVFLSGGNLTFTFATPVSAFGAYITGIERSGETLTFNDGSPQTIALSNPGNLGGVEFVGFTDAGRSISSITINTASAAVPLGDLIGVDDVRYVSGPNVGPAPVPEPGSMGLLGAALAGLLLRKRWQS